jgi:hypothetical protein
LKWDLLLDERSLSTADSLPDWLPCSNLLLVFAPEANIAAVLRFIQLFYGSSEDLEICNHQDNLFEFGKDSVI